VPVEVEARIEYRFVEDGRIGTEHCPLTITAPSGFMEVREGVFLGRLDNSPATFAILSSPYSADWTARLSASCIRVATSKDSNSEGDGS
jgi:hypothetical protein